MSCSLEQKIALVPWQNSLGQSVFKHTDVSWWMDDMKHLFQLLTTKLNKTAAVAFFLPCSQYIYLQNIVYSKEWWPSLIMCLGSRTAVFVPFFFSFDRSSGTFPVPMGNRATKCCRECASLFLSLWETMSWSSCSVNINTLGGVSLWFCYYLRTLNWRWFGKGERSAGNFLSRTVARFSW